MDEKSINQIFEAYLPKVIRLAEFNIAPGLKHRIEAEDIGSTVFRTVCRRISEGTFRFEDDESLWRQLIAITLNRLRNKIRDDRALKRGGGKAALPLDDFVAVSSEPDAAHAVELMDVIASVADRLDEKTREILQMRMAGYDHVEISKAMECSTKTVQRKMALAKCKLEEVFPESVDFA